MAKKKSSNDLQTKLDAAQELLKDKDKEITALKQFMSAASLQQESDQEKIVELTNNVSDLESQIESDQGLRPEPNAEIESLKARIAQFSKTNDSLLRENEALKSRKQPSQQDIDTQAATEAPLELVVQCVAATFNRTMNYRQLLKCKDSEISKAIIVAEDLLRRCPNSAFLAAVETKTLKTPEVSNTNEDEDASY